MLYLQNQKKKLLYQTQKQSNLIYDVGMHKGEDTLFYLKKGYNVIAFEANPDLVAECRIKFADEIKNNQLVIIEGAIVDSNTKTNSVKFFKNKCDSFWGTVSNEWAQRNEKLGIPSDIIEVQAINFVDSLKTYGIPYYLKIDIEGMDIICLKALQYFSEKPDYVSIESEKISFRKLKKEFDLLSKLGYLRFKAINQESINSQRLPSITKQGKYVNHEFERGSSGAFGTELPKKWKTKNQIINEYRRIFCGYKLFGDYGVLPNNIFRTYLHKIISKFSTSPIPGWYDTHAKHISANDK